LVTFENEICEIGKNNIQETTTAQWQIFELCFYVTNTTHNSPIESAKKPAEKISKTFNFNYFLYLLV